MNNRECSGTDSPKQIKVIYGDGIIERHVSTGDYAEEWEAARAQARQRGTYVRGFSRVPE